MIDDRTSATAGPVGAGGVPADLARLEERQRRRMPRALAAFVVGIALLGVAVWVVVRDGHTLSSGLEAIRSAPAGTIAALLGLYLVNYAMASATFWVLSNKYARVRYGEMLGLIAGATLLNYLPLRPGMVGRVAYHKLIHGIAVRDSIKVLVGALGCTVASVGCLVCAAWLSHAMGLSSAASVGLMALPLGLAVVGAWVLRRAGGAHAWRWGAALGFRYVDMGVWTLRYAMIFALIGRPLTPTSAAAVAFSSQIVMVSPVQLGLREWAVGAAASVLSPGGTVVGVTLPRSVESLAPGLLADLINRAGEFTVAIPLGLIATAVLYGRFRRVRRGFVDQDANGVNRRGPVAL